MFSSQQDIYIAAALLFASLFSSQPQCVNPSRAQAINSDGLPWEFFNVLIASLSK